MRRGGEERIRDKERRGGEERRRGQWLRRGTRRWTEGNMEEGGCRRAEIKGILVVDEHIKLQH